MIELLFAILAGIAIAAGIGAAFGGTILVLEWIAKQGE